MTGFNSFNTPEDVREIVRAQAEKRRRQGCKHMNFAAKVDVARLTDKDGNLTGFMAEIRINCAECQRQFQFLGLEPGVDTRGARVSVDGLEAFIALCPQGEVPSPLDAMSFNIRVPEDRKH